MTNTHGINPEYLHAIFDRLKQFLAVPKDTNNLQSYNAFRERYPMVEWHPEIIEERVRSHDGRHLLWRRLSYKEFLTWYFAERSYLGGS